jgi:hypothetical protein
MHPAMPHGATHFYRCTIRKGESGWPSRYPPRATSQPFHRLNRACAAGSRSGFACFDTEPVGTSKIYVLVIKG